jgi:Holliday junction DNA helicase RuvB
MAERLVSGKVGQEDEGLETSLRPQVLRDFVGQEKVKENLHIAIQAAKMREEPLDHILLYSPPGLGKTTLGNIIAREMGVNIRVTSGPAIERAGDMAAILTGLNKGDILFIDEVHRLSRPVEEVLYPAMEDFFLSWIVGKGLGARSMNLRVNPFTLIGATTRYAMISPPLRDRFGSIFRLDFYDKEAMVSIVHRSSSILNVAIEGQGVTEIANRSRGTPRVANRLLKRTRDYAQVMADGQVTRQVALDALAKLEVDPLGLDEIDRRLLRSIIEKFSGGPVGLDTLAASISEEADTIMDIYEPYLLQLGFLERTPRGRAATPRAYQHLGITPEPQAPEPSPQGKLL